MAFTEFRPLDEKSLIEYIKTVPSLYSKLGSDLKVKEVGDGNLNFVYVVVSHAGSFVIKQVCSFPKPVSGHICILIFIGWVLEKWIGRDSWLDEF